jgi:ABC-type transport system involved in cytochrome bd biosynthesis fused ATPase/permease subunit
MKILDRLFNDYLSNKTRIIVTNSVDFLHYFDRVLLLKKGKIVAAGTPSEL